MHDPDYQQRFGLYLEVFLNKIGCLRQIYENECFLINHLVEISEIPFQDITKEELVYRFTTRLKYLDKKIINFNSISMPFDFKIEVGRLVVEKCRIMKSKKKPIWLVFKNKVLMH